MATDYDRLWISIVRSPLAGTYLTDLYGLASSVVALAEEVFEESPRPGPDRKTSYIKVDHALMAKLLAIVGWAARIRALLCNRPRRRNQSAKQYEIQDRRAAWLRDEVLKGVKLSETFSAEVRNSLEHFDEYVDDASVRFAEHKIPTPALVPVDFAVGRRSTLGQFQVGGQRPHIYFMKVYIASERVFINCGREISIQKLHTECRRIAKRLQGLVPDEQGQERGSSILVLTPETFPGNASSS